MNSSFKRIDEKAMKLLQQSDALALPVNLNQVIGRLGLSLNEKPLENEYSGFLAVKEKTIVVNLRHPPARRRFTIAHEIGHYQLHRRSEDIPVFIDRSVYHRKESVAGVDHLMEMQANAYAAGLLMPEALLDAYLEKHPAIVDLERPANIKTLAEEFEVSRPAMEFRLINLGFVLRTSF